MEPRIDFLGHGSAQGEVASRILAQRRFDPNRMRPWIGDDGRTYVTNFNGGDPSKPTSYSAEPTNYVGTLRRDEWKRLDEAVLAASRQRLGGVDDLIANGLVYNIGNGMATTVLEYHDINDAMEAELSMDGVGRSTADRPVYGTNYLPLPIIHADFEINARVLAASRTMGTPLDTTSIEMATRRVLEKREAMLFTDTTYAYGGGTIYSYLNQSNRNLVTLAANWDASGKTGEQIVDDVLAMKQASIDDRHYGPWMLYIPTAYETVIDDDYVSGYPKTIRERIKEISGIKDVKTIDTLTANNVLLVQMTSDVVRLVSGMGIQVVEWKTEGELITKYKVMTIQVPQVRNDQSLHSGVVHLAA